LNAHASAPAARIAAPSASISPLTGSCCSERLVIPRAIRIGSAASISELSTTISATTAIRPASGLK